MHLPTSELPLPSGKVDALMAQARPAGGGFGAILAGHLKTLVREAQSMSLPEVKRLGATTLAWRHEALTRATSAADDGHTRR
ncbi:hypothetical protein ACNF49_25565 [Actinomadura sp. ATCC 39365]